MSSVNYAILGNGPDTPLPIVHPETGKEVPIHDRKFAETFTREHPIQGMRMNALVERIRHYTGLRIRELMDVRKLPIPEIEELVDETRQKMLEDIKSYPFLTQFTAEYRDERFRLYGDAVDNEINELIFRFFPGHIGEIGIANEVKAVNDPARLLIMIFNTSLSPRARYEARRKLILMELLANEEHCRTQKKGREESLGSITRFTNDTLIELKKGQKRGETQPHYMVSEHDIGRERMTEKVRIKPDPPKRLKANQRVTPLALRSATVKDNHGEQRGIRFFMDIREKDVFTRLLKRIRYDEPQCEIGDDHNDHSGIRMVFETVEDWVDFFGTLQGQLKKWIENALLEKLNRNGEDEAIKQKLNDIERCVKIFDEKGSLTEDEEFQGRSEASSDKLRVVKFRLRVIDSRGHRHVYEFQIFLPDGYADYLYREGVSWEEYNARRFFDDIAPLLFPPVIYGKIDFEDCKNKAIERASRRAWEAGEKIVTR